VLVSFRLAARRDVLAARQWYDAQAPGLGAAFATAVQEAVERLTLFPESAPMVAGKNRRILLGRFPYALYIPGTKARHQRGRVPSHAPQSRPGSPPYLDASSSAGTQVPD